MSIRDPFYNDSSNVTELMTILEDGLGRSSGQDPTIAAIRRLSDLKEKNAIPLLRRALNHSNVTVRTDSALALYNLGESGGLDALITLLSDDKSVVSAIRALAKTKDEKAISSLQNLKVSSSGRSHMFNGDMMTLDKIVDIVLNEVMPERFPRPSGSSSKGGCFIATAVYGSYEADQVIIFRKFRDEHLLKTAIGKVFVKIYYSTSPFVARFVRSNSLIRNILKNIVFNPLVKKLSGTTGGNKDR